MTHLIILLLFAILPLRITAAELRVFPDGRLPTDIRLNELKTLNGYFPFLPVASIAQWAERKAEIRQRLLISQGLWPMPQRTPLNAVVHKRLNFDDYSVEAVYFESLPGHYVTGSLYRPQGKTGQLPAVLCPHGHWPDARFYDAGESAGEKLIAAGAERFISAARNHIQARCVQLARMGCVVFLYDTTGNSDSLQIKHRPEKCEHLDKKTDWGYFAVQADLRLQNMMGLQTWNSIRSLDFIQQLPGVDPDRMGVTGASGGGTQSMILAAIDERISAAMPCVMVSTAMQGGCTCENAPLMRIGQGNVDIAAAIAPRPLGLTAADDWTRELETKGYPSLQKLYEMLGHKQRLTAVFHTQFPHNYNCVNRAVMYAFFNRHFHLGLEEPVSEQDFARLSQDQLTVWSAEHPPPKAEHRGDAHEIRLLKRLTQTSQQQLADLVPQAGDDTLEFQHIIGGAWSTILGRSLDDVGTVKFSATSHHEQAEIVTVLGKIDHEEAQEQFPIVRLKPQNVASREILIWISVDGKQDIADPDTRPAEVEAALSAGYEVIGADLFGQGEFLPDAQRLTSQRLWYQRTGKAGWERFSGYTYGYNHCLFSQRTHDILTLLKYAQDVAGERRIYLAGLDDVAGPLVIAARSQAGNAVLKTFANVGSFRFEGLDRHDAPMFVPGAVKYLDIDGLLATCLPYEVTVSGIAEGSVATQVYAAAEIPQKLQRKTREELTTALTQSVLQTAK